MIRCLACGTENLDSSQFCDECGQQLNQTNKSRMPESISAIIEQPVFQSAHVTSIGIPPMVEELKYEPTALEPTNNHQAGKGIHAKLVIERGASVGTEFSISSDESNIGRWDADNGIFPDIDLDTHDPEAKVSRRHARIIYENDKFLVEDLGSTNGTFVNRGRRLIPGTPQPLGDGDELIVGKTFMRFYVVNQ